MEVISPIDFSPVVVDGNLYITENNICLQSKKDGQLILVELTEDVKQMFLPTTTSSPVADLQADTAATSSCQLTIASASTTKGWSRNAILCLIEVVKNKQERFKSTKVKHDIVWREVSEEMSVQNFHYTGIQCKDKWKYLKAKYTRKKDNMSSRSTGEENIKFEFFDQLDEFLGTKHQIQPPVLASSLKKHQVPDDTDESILSTSDNDQEEPPPKKKKILRQQHPIQMLINEVRESSKKREENINKRHADMLASREKAVEVYSSKMDALLQVLKKD